jgi:hypothetical protein
MESRIPANGSTDQSGSIAPISIADKFEADVLAKPVAGTRINEINIMDKKQLNLFQKLFSIFHMYYLTFGQEAGSSILT